MLYNINHRYIKRIKSSTFNGCNSAIVDGLWNKKNDPELYRTYDLAEVKSTMDTTVGKLQKVRVAEEWRGAFERIVLVEREIAEFKSGII